MLCADSSTTDPVTANLKPIFYLDDHTPHTQTYVSMWFGYKLRAGILI